MSNLGFFIFLFATILLVPFGVQAGDLEKGIAIGESRGFSGGEMIQVGENLYVSRSYSPILPRNNYFVTFKIENDKVIPLYTTNTFGDSAKYVVRKYRLFK
ncbi:MAG: hypothetical protein C0621_04710 [Desulfuromonas sp.]|nr:MAG: hypothetical protein C0621_04710 [Desulfuromonas sp.]